MEGDLYSKACKFYWRKYGNEAPIPSYGRSETEYIADGLWKITLENVNGVLATIHYNEQTNRMREQQK